MAAAAKTHNKNHHTGSRHCFMRNCNRNDSTIIVFERNLQGAKALIVFPSHCAPRLLSHSEASLLTQPMNTAENKSCPYARKTRYCCEALGYCANNEKISGMTVWNLPASLSQQQWCELKYNYCCDWCQLDTKRRYIFTCFFFK